MKIVSSADNQVRRYACPRCGTVFEAGWKDTNIINERMFDGLVSQRRVVRCPFCGNEEMWINGEITETRGDGND